MGSIPDPYTTIYCTAGQERRQTLLCISHLQRQ